MTAGSTNAYDQPRQAMRLRSRGRTDVCGAPPARPAGGGAEGRPVRAVLLAGVASATRRPLLEVGQLPWLLGPPLGQLLVPQSYRSRRIPGAGDDQLASRDIGVGVDLRWNVILQPDGRSRSIERVQLLG